MDELNQGAPAPGAESNEQSSSTAEANALHGAIELLAQGYLEQSTAAFRAVLESYPNCVEAREFLEVAYKASSEDRAPVDVVKALKTGSEAFSEGRQREAIEVWKQCLAEEPANRLLQKLVLLSTTWSKERRNAYAHEVLSRQAGLMNEARAEEVEALVKVAETVHPESGPEDTIALEPPVPSTGPAEEARQETGAKKAAVESATAPIATSSRGDVTRRPLGRAHRRSAWPIAGLAIGIALLSVVIGYGVFPRDGSIPSGRLESAAQLASSGQHLQAVSAYDAILEQFGDHVEVYLGRGRARLAAADTEAGLADLEMALRIDPGNSAIAEEIADVLYSEGNFVPAIEYYEKAFSGGGGSVEARYRTAVSLVQVGRGDDALEPLAFVVERDPAHGEARFLLGQLLNERGRYPEAERALREAQPHVEAGSDFLAELGVALLEQGRLDEAEEGARSFIQSYPSDPRARAILGEVYLVREQYEPARDQLIQALRIDPREPRAQIALGRTWLAIGKIRQDAQDLAKARQILESAKGVHEGKRLLALGQVAMAEGDLKAAESLLLQSIERGGSPLAAHLSLAEVRTRSQDLAGAAEHLQRASAVDPQDASISLSLAIVYIQLRETSRAAEQFLKTIHAIGLLSPPGADSGPVVLPEPYVPLPRRFDVNRAIRDAYGDVLKRTADDPTASELKTLAELTSFVLAG